MAGRLVRALKRQDSGVKITEKDELCVEIAALCHDLGECSFFKKNISAKIPMVSCFRHMIFAPEATRTLDIKHVNFNFRAQIFSRKEEIKDLNAIIVFFCFSRKYLSAKRGN